MGAENLPLEVFDLRTVQHVASRYMDYATPAHKSGYFGEQKVFLFPWPRWKPKLYLSILQPRGLVTVQLSYPVSLRTECCEGYLIRSVDGPLIRSG